MPEDTSLEALLNLDGETFVLEKGYWVKFNARRVPATRQIPQGIRYSLTLHDRYNNRILGFDNAHAVKTRSRKRYHARKVTWDHRHKLEKIENYNFKSAGRLLENFWKSVQSFLSVT